MPCSVLQLLVLGKLHDVPIVHPNDVSKVNLYRSIAFNNAIPITFRMREMFSLPQASSAPENLNGYWLDCKQTRE